MKLLVNLLIQCPLLSPRYSMAFHLLMMLPPNMGMARSSNLIMIFWPRLMHINLLTKFLKMSHHLILPHLFFLCPPLQPLGCHNYTWTQQSHWALSIPAQPYYIYCHAASHATSHSASHSCCSHLWQQAWSGQVLSPQDWGSCSHGLYPELLWSKVQW